jgi:hypothetical protein
MNYIVNAQDPNKGLLGGLKGIQFAPNYEVGTYLGTDGIIVPKLFKVTLSFTVLHEHTTGWVKHESGGYGFGTSRGIDYPYNNTQQATAGNIVPPEAQTTPVSQALNNAVLAVH